LGRPEALADRRDREAIDLESLKGVLFDLDETLFDHKSACKQGIESLRARYPALSSRPVEHLERLFWDHLSGQYKEVLAGKIDMKASRQERIALLFEVCGHALPDKELRAAAALYVETYGRSSRAVPGASELVTKLREAGCRIAVVTNGFESVQADKLNRIGFQGRIDALIASEKAGWTKPDRRIFESALASCGGLAPEEAVVIGDLWEVDIVGARQAGIRAIWLNRRHDPVPDSSMVDVIREPMEAWPLLFRGLGVILSE
jgi:putative hydrolase of the HAD superfamily